MAAEYGRYDPKLVKKLHALDPFPVDRQAKYSGRPSVAFWDRVNRIKNKKLHAAVYVAGCALQDHEERVLQILKDAETK